MSDFAFGATFAMLVMTAIVLLTGYGVCVRDYWRNSKLPNRTPNTNPSPPR